jgi:hypothetical protein
MLKTVAMQATIWQPLAMPANAALTVSDGCRLLGAERQERLDLVRLRPALRIVCVLTIRRCC